MIINYKDCLIKINDINDFLFTENYEEKTNLESISITDNMFFQTVKTISKNINKIEHNYELSENQQKFITDLKEKFIENIKMANSINKFEDIFAILSISCIGYDFFIQNIDRLMENYYKKLKTTEINK